MSETRTEEVRVRYVRYTCGCKVSAVYELLPMGPGGWSPAIFSLSQMLGGLENLPICRHCGQRLKEEVRP